MSDLRERLAKVAAIYCPVLCGGLRTDKLTIPRRHINPKGYDTPAHMRWTHDLEGEDNGFLCHAGPVWDVLPLIEQEQAAPLTQEQRMALDEAVDGAQEQAAPSPCQKGHPPEYWKHYHYEGGPQGMGGRPCNKPCPREAQSDPFCEICAEITAAEQLAVAGAARTIGSYAGTFEPGQTSVDAHTALCAAQEMVEALTPALAKAQKEKVIADAQHATNLAWAKALGVEYNGSHVESAQMAIAAAVEAERERCALLIYLHLPSLGAVLDPRGYYAFTGQCSCGQFVWPKELHLKPWIEHVETAIRSRPSTDALELALARATKEAFEAALDCQSAMQAAHHPLYLAACAKLEGK